MSAKFPFDFQRHFVPDTNGGDCLPSCIAMAARYWSYQMPQLSINPDLDYWVEFVEQLESKNTRGTNVNKLSKALKNHLGSKDIILKIEIRTLIRIDDCSKFIEYNPPIPVIFLYDATQSESGYRGGGHAIILQSFDTKREKKIWYIDPARDKLMKASIIDLTNFIEGWEVYDKTIILVYPSTLNLKFRPISQNDTLLRYMETP